MHTDISREKSKDVCKVKTLFSTSCSPVLPVFCFLTPPTEINPPHPAHISLIAQPCSSPPVPRPLISSVCLCFSLSLCWFHLLSSCPHVTPVVILPSSCVPVSFPRSLFAPLWFKVCSPLLSERSSLTAIVTCLFVFFLSHFGFWIFGLAFSYIEARCLFWFCLLLCLGHVFFIYLTHYLGMGF